MSMVDTLALSKMFGTTGFTSSGSHIDTSDVDISFYQVENLDYGFVRDCSDIDELRRLLAVMRWVQYQKKCGITVLTGMVLW